jgi:hypothetical protein
MCGIPSKPSLVTVKKLPPLAPKLLIPSNGSTDVALKPPFEWLDPGAGQENHAESYELVIVTEDGQSVPGANIAGLIVPAWPLTVALKNGTTYKWQVISTNSTGSTYSVDSFLFATKDAPSPPPAPKPVLSFVLPTNPPAQAMIYSNNSLGFPYDGSQISAMIDVKNSGSTASPDYKVHFDLINYNTQQDLGHPDVLKSSLAPGATNTAGFVVQLSGEANFQITATLIVNGKKVDSAFHIV